MERSVYNNMRAIERDHWWFRARRKILADQVSRLKLGPDARILEVGCGTGGNLEMLSHFGAVTGLEPDEESREYASDQTGVPVVGGTLPDGLPAFQGPFDLIAALDVIEHLDDDAGSLAALRKLLKPDGFLLTTVPAHPWMWSQHDALHHHKRRYRKAQYLNLIETSGFRLTKGSYFNSFLFPAIALARLARFTERTGGVDDALPAKGLNALLTGIFGAEKMALRHMNLPFGVSLLVIAQPTP
jgi:SAM-dependent methyltransferase